MDPISTANAVVSTIGKAIDFFQNNIAAHSTDNSMIRLTQLTRAEPLTVISQDCANYEFMPSVLNTVCSLYSSFFLQAVAIMSMGETHIEIVKILDALNPNRDNTGFMLQSRHSSDAKSWDDVKFALENCEYRLPTTVRPAMEADTNRDNIKLIYEIENLAVGKQLAVEICVPGGEAGKPRVMTVPVNVRMVPIVAPIDTINHIFTHRKGNESFMERLESVRTGRIELIKDMIFCRDLIREYRKATIGDKSGVLREIVNRVNKNRVYGMLSKNPSLAISSNVYVLSKETSRALEARAGLRFNKPTEREKLLGGSYAMVIAIVDPDSEIITFYFDGIAQGSQMTLRALKSNKKGPDISDVMQSLVRGQAPSF